MNKNKIIELINDFLKKANSDGVLTIDSGVKGNTVSIIGLIHGNEPMGLLVFNKLLEDGVLNKNNLVSGKIYLILGNYKAISDYKGKEDSRGGRYIDKDFNRIWEKDTSKEDLNKICEYSRKQEIISYINESDIVIDIHSTTLPSDLFGIITKNNNLTKEYTDILNVKYILSDIVDKLNGVSLIEYHSKINKNNISIALECGKHGNIANLDNTYLNIKNILSKAGNIKNTLSLNKNTPTYIEVFYGYNAIDWDISYSYSNNPSSFDYVKKGELIAVNALNEIYAPEDCYVLLPSSPVRYIGYELFYLGRKKY